MQLKSPRQALKKGIALIPEDRKVQAKALSLIATIKANLAVMALQKGLGRLGFIPVNEVNKLGERYVRELEVSTPNPDAVTGTLSGGNRQKMVLGKALATDPEILIVDQPTAGVDVGIRWSHPP